MHGRWIDGLDWFPEPFPLIIFCFLEFFLKPTLFFSSSIYFQLGAYQNYRMYKKELFIFSKLCVWTDLATYCSIQGSGLINTNWYGKSCIENILLWSRLLYTSYIKLYQLRYRYNDSYWIKFFILRPWSLFSQSKFTNRV